MNRHHALPLPSALGRPQIVAASRVTAANGLAMFFGVAAVLNAIWIAGLPAAPVRVRAAHHFYDAGELLFAGLLASAAVEAWRKWGPRQPVFAYLQVALVAIGFGTWTLAEDFSGIADRMATLLPPAAANVLLCSLFSLSVPFAMWLGSRLAAPRLRIVGIASAIAILVVNPRVLQNGYPAVHLFITLFGVTLGAAALAGAPLPFVIPAWLGHTGRLALAIPSAIAVVSFPSSTVLAELYRLDTAVLAPWIAEFHSLDTGEAEGIPPDLARWFTRHDAHAEAKAAGPALLPEAPIVILITIDALRGDVVRSDLQRQYSPFLHSLRDSGVYFSNAHSFSSGTRLSLGSLFTSQHFSQLPWRDGKTLRPRLATAAGPRLPQLLASGGVVTSQVISHSVLATKTGVTLGFEEQTNLAQPDDAMHPRASQLLGAIAERLGRVDARPLFIYTHLMDPHAPYNFGGRGKDPFESYLLEVKSMDAEIAKLFETIDRLGLTPRTAVLIASDHGEAFGEHGEFAHDKSLHEVQVDVPLLASIPGVAARHVSDPVSLLDVAPTVLDLFGLPTPAAFMGISLSPYFRGENAPEGRPIYMENRSAYALVFADGYKAIIEPRRKREAVYHLRNDPGETEDLTESEPREATRHLELLRSYRGVHAARD
jgi:hypothetical protein